MGAIAAAVQWREPSLAEERQRRQKAVDEFTRRLKDNVRPTCIIVFGSVAKGTDRIESDLDIVVIGGTLPARIFDRLDNLARLKRGIPVSIDAFPYTESEFEHMLENKHVTALDCMYEGKPLHGEDFFKRLRVRFDEMAKRGLRRTDCAWLTRPETP